MKELAALKDSTQVRWIRLNYLFRYGSLFLNKSKLGKLMNYLLNLNPFTEPIQLGFHYIFSFTFLNCKQGVSRICSFFLLY